MLRTNSKKAAENIRAYIIDHVENPDTGYTPSTFAEAARMVWDAFNDEFMGSVNERRYNLHVYKTWQGCFEAWCSGLPGILDTSYYLHRAVKDLGDILEETEEERARFSETDAEGMLSRLIFREVFKSVN